MSTIDNLMTRSALLRLCRYVFLLCSAFSHVGITHESDFTHPLVRCGVSHSVGWLVAPRILTDHSLTHALLAHDCTEHRCRNSSLPYDVVCALLYDTIQVAS